MTITISVSPQTEDRLKAGAAANGTDVSQYASRLIENAVARSDAERGLAKPAGERVDAWNSFVKAMVDSAGEFRTASHLDDSRESIYAGRGE